MSNFEVITTSPLSYFYVEKSSSMDQAEIGAATGNGFQQVYTYLMTAGVAPTGAALSVYTSPPSDGLNFHVGFGVSESDLDKAGGGVSGAILPAQQAIRYLHKGPYAGLGAVYGEIQKHLDDKGLACTGPSWEIYLNDPSTVAPEDLETEVFMPVA